MAKTDIIGSWYNSGFHGHFRSKSRSDFHCEYRHLAKPPPPKVFSKRSKEAAATHLFSKHDNRHSFMDDALYFEQGMGRRRIKSRCTSCFNPDLLTWMPLKREFDGAPPKKSVYKKDYTIVPPGGVPIEMLVQRPKTSFDDKQPVTTSYRYAHGNDHPNKALLNAMSNLALSNSSNTTTRAVKSAKGRESVGACLTWQPVVSKPNAPNATPLYVPQPPSTPMQDNFIKEPVATEQTADMAGL